MVSKCRVDARRHEATVAVCNRLLLLLLLRLPLRLVTFQRAEQSLHVASL